MASIPGFRFDIIGASGSQNLLSPKASWRCFVLPRGGYASQDSTGTLITFDSASVASRFAVNSWIQAGLLTSNIRQVGSVGGNSINVSGAALTVAENTRIFIFGSTEPTVSGGSATYTVPNTIIRQRDDDAADLYTNSMITSNSDGLVQGFGEPSYYDCIVQDGNQANQGYIADLQVGVVEGVSVNGNAVFGGSVTIHGGIGVTGIATFSGHATFGSTVTMNSTLGVTGHATFGQSVTINGNLLVSGDIAVAAFGNIRWAHLYADGSETGGIQEAIDSITDASETNPYTVMLRPGLYSVDRSIDAGTQTGTANFTAAGTAVAGTGTKFKSTQALTGTATFTENGETVTGVGTLFLTELQAGDHIQRTTDADDGAGTDHSGTFGRVLTIESNTSLTLEGDGPNGGYSEWTGATGSGNIRFREFRVGDSIYGGVDASSLASRISSITDDTNIVLSEGSRTVYAGTSQNGVAVKKQTNYRTAINLLGTALVAKDYIALAGMDRRSCVIKRERAAGTLTVLVQGPPALRLSNLTLDSKLSREVHWDNAAAISSMQIDSVDFLGTVAGGISTGAGVTSGTTTRDTLVVLTNNYVEAIFAIHGAGTADATYQTRIFIVGNTFRATGTVIGLDFSTNGTQKYDVVISGNAQPYYNVDPGNGGVDLIMPTTLANQVLVRVYTDGSLRFANSSVVSGLTTSNSADYFWNSIIYPMERTGYQSVDGTSSGDVLVFNPAAASLGTTTTTAALWPTVVCNQSDSAGTATWFPRLCTGLYGACFVNAGTTVTVGDVLVTSGTSWCAGISNTVTDMTRIVGWAFSGKTAGTTRGLVNFRRNMSLGW